MEEQPMDYAVALSKTTWAAQANLAAAVHNLGVELKKSWKEVEASLCAFLLKSRLVNK